MRRVAVAAVTAVAAAGLAACGSSSAPSAGSTSASTASCTYSGIQNELYTKGALTVATDKPVYPPWFENNNPANGKGYESAVAYAIADQLGFKPIPGALGYEPFNRLVRARTEEVRLRHQRDLRIRHSAPRRSRSRPATTTCSRPWSRSRALRSPPSTRRPT